MLLKCGRPKECAVDMWPQSHTHTHTHTHTPTHQYKSQPTKMVSRNWLQHLTCDHAQIHLESSSPHCCRCLDWSTCSKRASGYLRHSVFFGLCSEFLRASSIQGTPKSKRGWQLWLQTLTTAVWGFHSGDHPPYLIACFLVAEASGSPEGCGFRGTVDWDHGTIDRLIAFIWLYFLILMDYWAY